MSDKDNTFIFEQEEDVKPHINRTATDTYSAARRGTYNKKKKKEEFPILMAVAIALAVVLLIAIIVGIIVLNSGKGNDTPVQKPNPEEGIIDVTEPEDEEEEEDEVNYYGLVFNSDNIYMLDSGDGFAVYADLFDNNGQKVGKSRKVRITEETEIRDNGMLMTLDAFRVLIENQGGDRYIFGSEIREEDSVIMYIAYDSRTFEENIPENSTEEIEGENPSEEEPIETPEETPIEGEAEIITEAPSGI